MVLAWMMLDRFVYRRDEDGFPDESTAPLRATSTTSLGQPFDVAILHAEPPAVSRLYVRWPGGTKRKHAAVELVAAHRDLILFRLFYFHLHLTYDHFLCVACSHPAPHIQLKRLPLCTIPMAILPPFFNQDTDTDTEGTITTTDRCFLSNTVGLFRGSSPGPEEEFVVAQLASITKIPGTNDRMEAEVCVLRSRVSAAADEDATWEIQKIPIQHRISEYSDLYHWSTSAALYPSSTCAVITFKNCICWISYYAGGILFYDLLAETPNIVYLALPTNYRSPYNRERGFLEVNRSICVTGGGGGGHDVLKYTSVVRTDRRLCGPIEDDHIYKVIANILKTTETGHMEWVPVTYYATSCDFWRQNTAEHLPRDAALTYPLVSMDDPNIIHFLLSEEGETIDKVSLVTMDMLTYKIISVVPYIKGEEDLCGQDADMATEKSHLLKSFLPSEFPKFLNLTRDR